MDGGVKGPVLSLSPVPSGLVSSALSQGARESTLNELLKPSHVGSGY